jgi:hypothetical protein
MRQNHLVVELWGRRKGERGCGLLLSSLPSFFFLSCSFVCVFVCFFLVFPLFRLYVFHLYPPSRVNRTFAKVFLFICLPSIFVRDKFLIGMAKLPLDPFSHHPASCFVHGSGGSDGGCGSGNGPRTQRHLPIVAIDGQSVSQSVSQSVVSQLVHQLGCQTQPVS